MRKIVTSQENPPIPSTNYDWSACREDWDLGDKIGYGKTELDAINDLLEKEDSNLETYKNELVKELDEAISVSDDHSSRAAYLNIKELILKS